MVKPHASKSDYEAAFKGFHYPMSRSAIVNQGRDKGGLDREVAFVLAQLPERRYKNAEAIKAAVREVYLAQGVPAEELPL